MATRFWVGGSGNWDASDTTHWAASSNGPGGQSVPTLVDSVTFDVNSGGAGTVITGTATMNCLSLTSSSANNTFSPGSNTINLAGTTGTVWSWTAGTFTKGSSIIVVSTASTSTRTFAGSGKIYETLTYTVANSSGILAITGANTFSNVNVASTRVLKWPSGVINTIVNTLNVTGTINGYLYLPGVAGNYVSAPDSAALSVTGDITIDVKVAMDDWTPAILSVFLSKFFGTTNQRSYHFCVTAAGLLQFQLSEDGTNVITISSTVATGFADGSVNWVRMSWKANDGAAHNVLRFYTSSDGSTWTQLGSTVTTATARTLFDSNSNLNVGGHTDGTGAIAAGKFYNTKVYNADLGNGSGTPVFDADFIAHNITTTNWLDDAKTQFAETSTNAATVTINGALAQAGGGRVVVNASTPGSAATISAAIGAVISAERISLQDSTATGGARFAAVQSVKVSNVIGWSVNEHVGWGAPV